MTASNIRKGRAKKQMIPFQFNEAANEPNSNVVNMHFNNYDEGGKRTYGSRIIRSKNLRG